MPNIDLLKEKINMAGIKMTALSEKNRDFKRNII